jgi:hypothetical protein
MMKSDLDAYVKIDYGVTRIFPTCVFKMMRLGGDKLRISFLASQMFQRESCGIARLYIRYFMDGHSLCGCEVDINLKNETKNRFSCETHPFHYGEHVSSVDAVETMSTNPVHRFAVGDGLEGDDNNECQVISVMVCMDITMAGSLRKALLSNDIITAPRR